MYFFKYHSVLPILYQNIEGAKKQPKSKINKSHILLIPVSSQKCPGGEEIPKTGFLFWILTTERKEISFIMVLRI